MLGRGLWGGVEGWLGNGWGGRWRGTYWSIVPSRRAFGFEDAIGSVRTRMVLDITVLAVESREQHSSI